MSKTDESKVPINSEKETSSTPPKRSVILDSNVIQNYCNKAISPNLFEVFQKVVDLGYSLAISEFTYYELLNEATISKEKELIGKLNGLNTYRVTSEVLIAAAHIGSLYKDDGVQLNQISSGDKIIAATAILTNSLIYTTNARDFPIPFFKEVVRYPIEYISKKQPVHMYTSFLEPDLEFTDKCHSSRVNKK
jgi:predicted nucleic acid-binding protein